MQNFGLSMLWFWSAYIIVTLIGILHTIFNIYVLHMKPMDKYSMGEGYEKTKPWHPLYNIIIFTMFGFVYMNGLTNPTIGEALVTGAIWVGICIVFDVFGWVIIKHPWSLTFKQFYVEYQPWITLIYIAIFIGPILGYLLTLI
ncbi:MAG: hypothetical protein SOY31_01365 [Bacilli bacterium]|nr:hypothetical protein [Bacilli bacterium]